MNGRRLICLCRVALFALALLAVVVEPAVAQTSEVGRNVGREIRAWASAILLGIAGMLAVPVLAKRDVSGGLVLVLLVVLVGGFVFAPQAVRAVIDGLWRAVGG